MPIASYGPLCRRRGCRGPAWREGLCPHCWRLARLFGRDSHLFAYQPAKGYRDELDADELPWNRWEREAGEGGGGIADLFASGAESPEDSP